MFVYVKDTLENCFFRSNCLTFESGDLFSGNGDNQMNSSAGKSTNTTYFDIIALEIWACGGTVARHI